MAQRHMLTSSSVWPRPAGWSLNQILPWICLLVVVSMTAYGVQLAAASMMASPAADRVNGTYPPLDSHDVSLHRAASTGAARVILITGQDATTGERMDVKCVTDAHRYEDVLLVELKDLREVAGQICNGADAPECPCLTVRGAHSGMQHVTTGSSAHRRQRPRLHSRRNSDVEQRR